MDSEEVRIRVRRDPVVLSIYLTKSINSIYTCDISDGNRAYWSLENGYYTHGFPHDQLFQMDMVSVSSESDYYSDEEQSSHKLNVLASICSAVLEYARNPVDPKPDAGVLVQMTESPFFQKRFFETSLPPLEKDALDVLAAPITPTMNTVNRNPFPYGHPQDEIPLFIKNKHFQPRPPFIMDPPFPPIPPHGPHISQNPNTNSYMPSMPMMKECFMPPFFSPTLTPPRSIGDIKSHPHTPQNMCGNINDMAIRPMNISVDQRKTTL
jgi:hypothetical protein